MRWPLYYLSHIHNTISSAAAGFKLSSTLSKLPTIKSADKTTSLLDFLVDQIIENDGECLNFLEELEVHLA